MTTKRFEFVFAHASVQPSHGVCGTAACVIGQPTRESAHTDYG
jgi:hypothetical protein